MTLFGDMKYWKLTRKRPEAGNQWKNLAESGVFFLKTVMQHYVMILNYQNIKKKNGTNNYVFAWSSESFFSSLK